MVFKNKKNGELLAKMLHIATTFHNGQFDKAGVPYILHPLKVMHYLQTDDEELMCIALGHDLLEDCGLVPAHLYGIGMSDRIVRGIWDLTKKPGQSYEDYKTQVKSNPDAIQVKMADLRHKILQYLHTDIRRLKGVTEKDIARYHAFYEELKVLC